MDNEIIPTPPIPQEPTITPEIIKPKKKYLLPIAFVLAIILLIGLVFYQQKQIAKQNVRTKEVATEPTIEPMQSSATSITPAIAKSNNSADWIAYKNTKYGFEIKYPKEYSIFQDVDQKKPEFIPVNSSSKELYITNNPNMFLCCEPPYIKISILDKYENNLDNNEINVKAIKDSNDVSDRTILKGYVNFAGEKAYRIDGLFEGSTILVNHNSKTYYIKIVRQELSEEILSTFRFADTKDVSISNNGSIYRDEVNGFEFIMPTNMKVSSPTKDNPSIVKDGNFEVDISDKQEFIAPGSALSYYKTFYNKIDNYWYESHVIVHTDETGNLTDKSTIDFTNKICDNKKIINYQPFYYASLGEEGWSGMGYFALLSNGKLISFTVYSKEQLDKTGYVENGEKEIIETLKSFKTLGDVKLINTTNCN